MNPDHWFRSPVIGLVTVTLLSISRVGAQPPADWSVNPSDYEHVMTVTAVLLINNAPALDSSNVVAAFSGTDCRGVTGPVYVLNQWMYFLMVYGNSADDSLHFQAFDATRDTILNVTEVLTFTADGQVGEPDLPFVLHAVDSTTLNLAPVLAPITDMVTEEDTPVEVTVSASDPNQDTLTFSAGSSDPAVEAVFTGPHLTLIPAENWNGLTQITVQVSDGEFGDTTGFTLTVQPVNDAPAAFLLLAPANDSVVFISAETLGDTLTLQWEPAQDVDGDTLEYRLVLTDGLQLLSSVPTPSNRLYIPHQGLYEAMFAQGLTVISGTWTVHAADSALSTPAANGPFQLTIDISTAGIGRESALPAEFALLESYPNPFNPVTVIRYRLPERSRVTLVVYDVLGREIRRLRDGLAGPGLETCRWDARNHAGDPVAAGVYLVRLSAGGRTATGKLVMVK